MRFFTTAIALLSLVASTLSAVPSEGTYVTVIVNQVSSPNGEELAITFNGKDHAATLTPFTNSEPSDTYWILQNYDGATMSVTPVSATDLQAAWGDGYVTVLPAGNYVWTIENTEAGYVTIQHGGMTVFWRAAEAVADQNVTIVPGTG